MAEEVRTPFELLGKERIIEPKKPTNPVSTKPTDTTNAEMFAEMYGDFVRFDHRRKRWLVWNNHYWSGESDGQVFRYAIECAKEMYDRASSIEDLATRTAVSKWAIQSQSKQKLDATLGIAKNLLPIADDGSNWDSENMLMAVKNGVIDLKTGKMVQGTPEQRLTMKANVEFDSKAQADRWKQFISEVFEGNEELIRFIQKALGYSLTGETSEQVAFFCHGMGSNGKSVLFKAIRELLGDYSYNAPASLLQRQYQSSSTNDVAATEHKRFLVSAETLSSSKLNEQRLKAWTGGDQETARYLYSEFFSFDPTVKIWLFLNHKPQVEDDSFGFWRRVRLIPFLRTFSGDEADSKLSNKLRKEYPGILNWLIEGCLLWQREGLSDVPDSVLAATKDYQIENDQLAEFLYDICTEGDTQIKASVLYKKYCAWAEEQSLTNRDVLTRTMFGRRMSDKYKKVHEREGWFYIGIGEKCDEFSKNPSLKTDDVTSSPPVFQYSPYENDSNRFKENDTKPVTKPQKPVTNPSQTIEEQFEKEEEYVD